MVLRSYLGRVGGRTIGCHRCGGVGGFPLKVVNKEGYNIWIDSTDGNNAKDVFLKSINSNDFNKPNQSPQKQKKPRDIHCPALGDHLLFPVSDKYDGKLQSWADELYVFNVESWCMCSVSLHYRFFGPNPSRTFATSREYIEKRRVYRGDSVFPLFITKREPKGCINAAYDIMEHNSFEGNVGIMVAANSGLPGGNLGNDFKIHANYRTQEEDVVSAWLNTVEKYAQEGVFNSNLVGRWGLIKPVEEENKEEYDTFQGINYTTFTDIEDMKKYGDAWVVKDVSLSCKTICGWQYRTNTGWDNMDTLNNAYNNAYTAYQRDSNYGFLYSHSGQKYTANFTTMIQTNVNTHKEREIRPKFTFDTTKTLRHADLFFVAAPNSNKGNEPHGSMARTLNTFSRVYRWNGTNSNKAHIKGVEAASRAALDAMIEEGITHAFLVGIGAGVYYNKDLWTEKLHLERIFNEILEEYIGPLDAYGKRAKRGQFFKQVYYITL